jgi:hypothetical protein
MILFSFNNEMFDSSYPVRIRSVSTQIGTAKNLWLSDEEDLFSGLVELTVM